jgi:hypothetical protein
MSSDPAQKSPPPHSDSPLYWLLLFGSAAIAALVLIEPKFAQREARLERMYHARQRAAARAQPGRAGQGSGAADRAVEAPAAPGESQAPIVSLRSLALLLAGILFAAACGLDLVRRHRPPEPGT